MATTTYEEEKKKRPEAYKPTEYTYTAPVGTYYGEEGNAATERYNIIRQRYAEAADPARQAEQDARIQRGRKFWTGANLFANVVANAINAHGTANDAPNMTYSDAATQKMYDTWRDADARLKADRDKAAQRLDALDMQDAQMRAAAGEKRAAEQANIFNINFQNAEAARKANADLAQKDYEWERAQEAALEKEKRDNETWKERNEIQYKQNERLARIRHSGSGSSSSSNGGVNVTVGGVNIPAKDKNDAVKIRKDVAYKIVDKVNADIDKRNAEKKKKNPFISDSELEKKIAKPKNDKEAENILYQYDYLYDDDEAFRKDINSAYGIEDPYTQEPEPEFDQYGGHSVMPEDYHSMMMGENSGKARRYSGSPYQNPTAFNTDRTTSSSIPPYLRKQYTKK